MWVTSRTGSVGWDLRKELVEFCLGRKRLTLGARRSQAGGFVEGIARVGGGGGRWKSQHRKMVCLSLCRKTFQLKGNKKFRAWTKKSSSVFVFRDSYVIYMSYEHPMSISQTWVSISNGWDFYVIYEHFMNIICTFHISVSWYITYFQKCSRYNFWGAGSTRPQVLRGRGRSAGLWKLRSSS